MTLGQRIKERREEIGLGRRELAAQVGMSYATLAGIENGDQGTSTRLHKLASALGVSPEWLETGAAPRAYAEETAAKLLARVDALGPERGEKLRALLEERGLAPDHAEVPVWDARAAAGGGAVNGDPVGPKGSILFRSRSLSKQGISTKNSHVWYVHGDSMVPRLRDGDAVLFDASDKTVRAGKVYVIRKGEETFVKRLYREGSRFRVVSDNKADPQWQDWFVEADDPDFEIIGRVRWVGSWEE